MDVLSELDFITTNKIIPMNIIKLNNGKAELRKDNGIFIRNIGGGDVIVDANINCDGTLIVITTSKGRVELRKENGTLVRNIGNNDAVGAKFNGTDILVKTNKGKLELRKENGIFIRNI